MYIKAGMTGVKTYKNESTQKKSIEKLSSGFRINKAADDVAGLAVSEKMRAQIRGLEQAFVNSQDALSLIKTADGSMEEIHSMLGRMRELTVKASNGTYEGEDRDKIQKEIEALTAAIDSIANTSHHNGIKLLNGSLKGGTASEIIPESEKISDVEGAEEVPETVASYTTEIDFDTIVNGSSLKINGKLYEFTTAADGSTNDASAIAVKINVPATSADKAQALADVFNNLAENVSNRTMTYKDPKLSIESDNAVNNEKINIEYGTTTVPDVIAEEGVYTKADDIVTSAGAKFIVSGIDVNTLKDGTTFNINGKIFEFDIDKVKRNPAPDYVIDISTATAAEDIKTKINQALGKYNTDTGAKMYTLAAVKSDGTITIDLQYKNKLDPSDQNDIDNHRIKLDFNDDPLKVKYKNEDNIVGKIHADEIPAHRVDKVDLSAIKDGSVITIEGISFEFDLDGILSDLANISVDVSTAANSKEFLEAFKLKVEGSSLTANYDINIDVDNELIDISNKIGTTTDGQTIDIEYDEFIRREETVENPGLFMHIGANSGDLIELTIQGVTAKDLDIININVRNEDSLSESLNKVDKAIDLVSINRVGLGANMNMLEHTMNNLAVGAENLTAADSRLRDADMAKEIMSFTKQNIIAQAERAMTAQAKNIHTSMIQQILGFGSK